ncbi:MAG: hypothetical protein BZ137_03945 [Methanosphaera sp. rholeuAM130]|nr:MAG: hypothetical protein BZ137_03945 [Methanosphaera sp. rholeuAM130]
MKTLIFEYSTCVGNNNLMSEGFEILKRLLEDLEYLSYDVDYLLMDNLNIDSVKKSNKITLKEDLFNWLAKNSSNYDFCLFVAPEDDLIQYKITKILEKNNVNLLTSNSSASYTCCSKILTYQKTPEDILKIPSIIIDTSHYDINLINDKVKYNHIICKPDNYTSSNYIYSIKKDELEDIIKIYQKSNIKKMLIQKFVNGTPISISAIINTKDVNILSINSQIIRNYENRMSYKGCVSPIKHPLENRIKEISCKIIKSIPGLKGFVGIDYIIDDKDIYFVEINSRITTPYIVLGKISNKNLTEYLIESIIHNKKMEEITFNDEGEFYNEK